MAESISSLKEKIKEAREKASKVKISVQSTQKEDACYRSYMSPAVPSPANSLQIEYRPTDNVDDSLIFITKTNQTRTRMAEYLALQLLNQRFVFVWNVGGGSQGDRKITLPHRIDSIAKKSKRMWYKIDVERQGNRANLTVGVPELDKSDPDNQVVLYKWHSQILIADPEEDDSADPPIPLPDSDAPAIFNTLPGLTRVSLGLIVADRRYIPEQVEVVKFAGTVGQVKFDGHNVPLWNFLDSSGTCSPYYSSIPNEIPITGYMFADGYAQIPKTGGYNSQTTYVIITFASYSENGLLYFRGNPNTKDFISIELEDGKIKTQINLGGTSKTKLVTEHSYNDGKRYVVQVRRSQLNASLEVTGVKSEYSIQLIPGNFKGLEADTDHLLGGVPESYPKQIWRSFNIQWKGFYGCIMSSTLNVDGRYLAISGASKIFNVRPSCRLSDYSSGAGTLLSTDRVVTFKGDGSFVLGGLEIRPRPVSSFGLNFRTKKDKGLLFYQSSKVTTRKRRDSPAESGFFAGFIEDCLLNIKIGTSSDDATMLTSTVKVCDGRLHTVFIKRKDLEVVLFIDDHFMAKEYLQQNKTIGSKEWSQLFLGGLGSIKAPREELPNFTPFTGCISDLHFNYRRLVLVPQRLDRAALGVCVNPINNVLYRHQNDGYVSDGIIDQYEETEFLPDDMMMESAGNVNKRGNNNNNIMMSDAVSKKLLLDSEEENKRPLYDFRSVIFGKKRNPRHDNRIKNETGHEKCSNFDAQKFGIPNAALYGSIPGTYSIPKIKHSRLRRTLDFTLSFSFRTWSKNETLLSWVSKSLNNYFLLIIDDSGKLKSLIGDSHHNNNKVIESSLTTTSTISSSSSDKDNKSIGDVVEVVVNDGHWHQIRVSKRGKTLKISCDAGRTKTKHRLSLRWMLKREKTGLTVGGLKKAIALKLNVPPHFRGCIKNFELDGSKLDFSQVEQHHGSLSACYENVVANSLRFLDENSSAVIDYHPLEQVFNRDAMTRLSFEFRLDQQKIDDGRALMICFVKFSPTSNLTFFVADHTLKLHLNNNIDYFLFENLKSCNTWHTVALEFSSSDVAISHNQQRHVFKTNAFVQKSNLLQITFGRVETNANIPSFQGCLKNVKLNEENVANLAVDKLKIVKHIGINECRL